MAQMQVVGNNPVFNNLIQIAYDQNATDNERITALANIAIRGEHSFDQLLTNQETMLGTIQGLIQLATRERQENIKKTMDVAIKHFQFWGHMGVIGSITGATTLGIMAPAYIWPATFSSGVCVSFGAISYSFEKKLRKIRDNPTALRALGSTTREVEESIAREWRRYVLSFDPRGR